MFGLNVKNELLDKIAEFCHENKINYEYWPKQVTNSGLTLLNFDTAETRDLVDIHINGPKLKKEQKWKHY